MSKRLANRTRVFMGGREIGEAANRIVILDADATEMVQVNLFVDHWEVDDATGGLIVHVHDGS